MPGQEFDKSSKWLLKHYGKAILSLGGARNVRRCTALQAEVVQPRRLPDGLLEVYFKGRTKPDYVLLEVSTYAEKRVRGQVLDDLTLVFQEKHLLPEMLTIVLRPKGKIEVGDRYEVTSRLGWSRLLAGWKTVELWKVPAKELLGAKDVGLIPLVSLTDFDEPPKRILEQCRERIESDAPPGQTSNLLAVSQVFARLRFPALLDVLGGREVMIESPLLQEIWAEKAQQYILNALNVRFPNVPLEIENQIHSIQQEDRLRDLHTKAVQCADLEEFRTALFA